MYDKQLYCPGSGNYRLKSEAGQNHRDWSGARGKRAGNLPVSHMLNPHRELEERITELTGIAWDMLKDAPDIGDILEEFLAFCGELPLLGHRIIFDYSFVKRAAVNQGLSFEKNGIDTLTICRRFMPAEESKRLGRGLCLLRADAGECPQGAGRCVGCPSALSETAGKAWSQRLRKPLPQSR